MHTAAFRVRWKVRVGGRSGIQGVESKAAMMAGGVGNVWESTGPVDQFFPRNFLLYAIFSL